MSKTMRWVTTAARVTAFLQGFPPEDVWPTYERFEEDTHTLFDTAEAVYNNVKWCLEERERAREREARETVQAVSSIVDVPATDAANGATTEEVEPENGVRRQEGIDHFRDEE